MATNRHQQPHFLNPSEIRYRSEESIDCRSRLRPEAARRAAVAAARARDETYGTYNYKIEVTVFHTLTCIVPPANLLAIVAKVTH